MSASDNTLQQMLRSLKTLPHVAQAHYKITRKGAGISSLDFTPIQLRMLYLLEQLLEKRSTARLVIVKPRQIMSTTAFNAAEFKFSYDIPGMKTLLLTHRAKVSFEIFESLKRFQNQMPEELRIETTQSNDYKLSWRNMSEVVVGTAGTDSGRGFPCMVLHLSELGRFKNRHVVDIQEGAMQAHASAELGSILLAESTSGGEGNFFHEIAKSGWKNPQSSWFTAFFGWHEMAEYRLKPPKGFQPDSDSIRLMDAFGLDVEQIYWRCVKLHDEMRGNLSAFQREYPATFEEAFSSAEGRLIDAVILLNALNSLTEVDKSQPAILGVDPAGKGDRTALVKRQGYVMPKYWVHNRMDDITLGNLVMRMMQDEDIDHVFIDMGYGHGTYHHLRSLGVTNITGVHFGSRPDEPQLYFNKRAEMAGRFQDWMSEGPDGMGGTARIPNTDEFTRDIKMIPELEYASDGQKFKLASKEDIKAELGKSPDIFDAAILTFAHAVRSKRNTFAGSQYASQGQSDMLVTNKIFREFQEDDNAKQNPNFKYFNYPR